MTESSTFDNMVERYRTGRTPWDAREPPPEVIETVAGLPPGRALDLGCGYGRAAIYLAQKGWVADGVDFIPQAITEARARAQKAGVSAKARFYLTSVVDLNVLTGPYDLALDVGCLHSLTEDELRAYRDELLRLLRPGGYYLLFVHVPEDSENVEERPRGITESDLLDCFAADFILERVEYGVTQVEDQPPWRSAWFWYQRR